MERICFKETDEKVLLDHFINEDSVELEQKKMELLEVVAKLDGFDAKKKLDIA